MFEFLLQEYNKLVEKRISASILLDKFDLILKSVGWSHQLFDEKLFKTVNEEWDNIIQATQCHSN